MQQPNKAPSAMEVPTQLFGAMMNTLASLPYNQVAELIGAVNQNSKPVYTSDQPPAA